jgi:hypothetical protein
MALCIYLRIVISSIKLGENKLAIIDNKIAESSKSDKVT